jgi:hypothetical protein
VVVPSVDGSFVASRIEVRVDGEARGNIQGTFGGHSGNTSRELIQGFTQPLQGITVPNVDGSFDASGIEVGGDDEAPGDIQGAFREHSGNIWGTFREHVQGVTQPLHGVVVPNVDGGFIASGMEVRVDDQTFREHSGNM